MQNRTRTLRSFVVALIVGLPMHALAATADKPLTVVELFTSQGCSSCPPADAFLGKLAREDDILALSMHVDYWDYIGWKDPFADPALTTRQRKYAARMELRYIYTPQMVIQGRWQEVGSKRGAIWPLIRDARKEQSVAIHIAVEGSAVRVRLPAQPVAEAATVWLVAFDARHDTKIARGENGGRTLSYYNVVRSMTPIARWNGEAFDATHALPAGPDGTKQGIAVLVQAAETGPILGAVAIRPEER